MKSSIKTIDKLIELLSVGGGRDGYPDVMSKLDIPKSEYEKYCTWDDNKYTRNLLKRTNDFELILMCWEPGQESLIHSYNDQQGWMYILEGELVVGHYFESKGERKMEFYKDVRVTKNRFLYVNDYLGFHNVSNATRNRCISLHLHIGPVDKWKVYDPETNSYFVGDTNFDADFSA